MKTPKPNPTQKQKRAFTLVEVVIAVIVLGLIASFTIRPRNDPRSGSIASTLQTIRSQIELFKIQHNDTPPDLNAAGGGWTIMLGRSTPTEIGPSAGSTTGTLGPYMQQSPINPHNNQSAVGTTFSTSVGWVYIVSGSTYTFSAVNTTGTGLFTY